MHVFVIKKFESGGKTLLPGKVVDATGWRWVEQLIEQRYVRETPAPEKKDKADAKSNN